MQIGWNDGFVEMKIVWAFHSGAIGGAQLTGLEALRGLQERGHETIAVIPYDGPLRSRLESVGVQRIDVVPTTRWICHRSRRSLWLTLRRLPRIVISSLQYCRLIVTLRPDVVVTSTITFPSAALGAWLARRPHVWFVQELGEEDFGAVFDWPGGMSWVSHLSRLLMTQSPAVLDKHAQLRDQFRALRAGVDVLRPSAIPPRTAGHIRLVLVGTLTRTKGQDQAMQALRLLLDRGHDVRLALVGAGTERDVRELEALAEELELTNRVDWVGFTPIPAVEVLQSDIALMCSRAEAFGRVTVEAMKLGLPVVASNSGSNPYLIRDGIDGLLYERGNPEDLANAIDRLIRDPELASRLAASGRARAEERFSGEWLAEDVESVLQEATS